MRWLISLMVVGFTFVTFACGTSDAPAPAGAGGSDGSATDGGSNDGPALEAGALACGSVTCQGTDYCVHPCCGGSPVPCTPIPDSGMCPPGSTLVQNCTNPGGPPVSGCGPGPCTPPAKYCSPNVPFGCSPEKPGSRDLVCGCG